MFKASNCQQWISVVWLLVVLQQMNGACVQQTHTHTHVTHANYSWGCVVRVYLSTLNFAQNYESCNVEARTVRSEYNWSSSDSWEGSEGWWRPKGLRRSKTPTVLQKWLPSWPNSSFACWFFGLWNPAWWAGFAERLAGVILGIAGAAKDANIALVVGCDILQHDLESNCLDN